MDISRSSSECSKRNDKKRERGTDNSDKEAEKFKLPAPVKESDKESSEKH